MVPNLNLLNHPESLSSPILFMNDGGEAVPEGAIAIWSGTIASIPANWLLCDGTNGTPDLRQKFIVGAPASTEAGGTGGATTHNHSTTSVGAHTHTAESTGGHTHTTASGGSHNHGGATHIVLCDSTGTKSYLMAETDAGVHTHTTATGGAHVHTLPSTGDHTHAIGNGTDTRPPYYDVLFIQATASAVVEDNIIIIWSGDVVDIPSGWSEYTTLREKFVEGAANGVDAGATGGSVDHVHSTTNDAGHTHGTTDSLGNHTHTFTSDSTPHNHGTVRRMRDSGTGVHANITNVTFAHQHATSNSIGAHTHTFGAGGVHNHGNLGSADSNKSLPAYMDVVFIKNTGSATTIPSGGILIWVGLLGDIPTDFDLCDGAGDTPDLRGKFIRGMALGGTVRTTGGSDTHNHTDNNCAGHIDHTQAAYSTAHQHATTDSIGAHTHPTSTSSTSGSFQDPQTLSVGNHTHTFTNDAWSHTHTPDSQGIHNHAAIGTADTRPPYYQVQFIYYAVSYIAYVRTVTEYLGGLETKSKIEGHVITKTELLGGLESKIISRLTNYARTVTEILGGSESFTRTIHRFRSFTEVGGGRDVAHGIIRIFRKFRKKFPEHPKQRITKS